MVSLSLSEKVMQIVIIIVLCALSFVAVVPLLSVLSVSFSSKIAVDLNQVLIWPKDFTFDSWNYMIYRQDLWRSFLITSISTIIGIIISLLVTALMAYPLAKKEFMLGKIIMIAAVITMIFKAPLVPYFLTVRGLGLFNNPLVLVIPHVLNAFNMIIMRTFFKQFPVELEEAAVVEGCGYFRLLFQIMLPLSKAVLATVGLFYAVVIWNQFLHPLLFIQNQNLFPLQLKIRQFIINSDEFPNIQSMVQVNYNERTLRATTIVFAIIPIILIYPYLQKYFVKGAMLGSVKG